MLGLKISIQAFFLFLFFLLKSHPLSLILALLDWVREVGGKQECSLRRQNRHRKCGGKIKKDSIRGEKGEQCLLLITSFKLVLLAMKFRIWLC